MEKKIKKPITKAVIAAAGFGTRFLPATKNQPKEMLPIIDKPIIHYLVEEAVQSGIKDIILVTRFGNHAIEDYFDNRYELESQLEQAGKLDRLELVRNIPQMANFVYVRQKSHLPYGNGSPLLAAKDLIAEDESIVYMFGDDLTLSHTKEPVTKQLINIFEEQNPVAVTAVQEVPWEVIHTFGSVEYKKNSKYPYDITRLLEKMPRDKAPSNMAQDGRFVLSYKVIKELEKTATGKDNELWLADVLNNLAKKHRVIAPRINGEWHTTGDPLKYIKTTLRFALEREDLREDVINIMKEFIA